MNSDFVYKGLWWFPDKPSEKFSGDLEIDSKGNLILTLLDEATARQTLEKKTTKGDPIPLIVGYCKNKVTKSDLAFSLFNCSIISYNVSGLAEFSLKAEYATTFKNYKDIDSLKIASAFLEVQMLNEWTDISGISNAKDKAFRKLKISVGYDQPKPITLLKNKDFHMYIWFYATYSQRKNTFNIIENARINIEFKKQKSFQEFEKYLELIKNFLSFCISVPVSCKKIEFRELSTLSAKRKNLNHQNTYELIISESKTYTGIKSIDRKHMLLEYKRIANNESFYITKWIDLNDRLEPVFKLYFDTLYNPGLYRENAFLNNVAALEIYHRINNPEFDGKDIRYYTKLDKIASQISNSNEKQWLLARMEKRKEASLFNRILNIVERTPTISKRFIKDFGEFATIVSNTRHYLTHFDHKNKQKGVATGEDLIKLISKTRVLIQIQILMDLGFTETETNALVTKAISNWHVWTK